MTDKQAEMMNKAKAILKILGPLSLGDRQTVTNIVYSLTEAEDRSRMEAEQSAMAAEKLAYMDKPYTNAGQANAIGVVPTMPGGLFRG